HPKKQLWKLIMGRALLIVSGLFWVLLLLGIAADSHKVKSEALEVILGGIILSFIPIVIGLILEISYHRKKKLFKKLTASQQTMVLAFPPVKHFIKKQLQKILKYVIIQSQFYLGGFLWTKKRQP
ncbi:MAG: PrsW family intrarane metalloprotease, partial [Acidobacteriota bacterium]|nr:PrsW family intrarane metalloprotease [Acidobacteriota bacterium]